MCFMHLNSALSGKESKFLDMLGRTCYLVRWGCFSRYLSFLAPLKSDRIILIIHYFKLSISSSFWKIGLLSYGNIKGSRYGHCWKNPTIPCCQYVLCTVQNNQHTMWANSYYIRHTLKEKVLSLPFQLSFVKLHKYSKHGYYESILHFH